MRVLLLTHAFPPATGGIESFSWALATGLAAAPDIEVTVATFTASVVEGEGSLPFKVRRAPSKRELFRMMLDTDIVVENSAFLSLAPLQLAARKPRVRVVHGLQNMQALEAHGRLRRTVLNGIAKVRQWWTKSADDVVVVSEFVARANRLAKPTIINNGYDSATFYNTTPPRLRPPGSLIAVGRLHHDKGFDLPIMALHNLREAGIDAHLTVVGDGPAKPELERLASTLGVGDHVHFTGSLLPAAVNQKLNEARIAVVPSRCEEAFGIVALEAQAAGCAVIAADIGGLPEALDGVGELFKPDDPADLSRVARVLITDDDAYSACIANDEHMRQRTNDQMVARYEALIRRRYALATGATT